MLANIQIDKQKFMKVQLAILIIGSLITFVTYGREYAISYALGAFVVFLANLVFWARFFMKKQFSPGVEILIFYLSEMAKLLLIGIITILLAIYIKPKLFAYIFGLISLQLLVCFIPMFLKKVR